MPVSSLAPRAGDSKNTIDFPATSQSTFQPTAAHTFQFVSESS